MKRRKRVRAESVRLLAASKPACSRWCGDPLVRKESRFLFQSSEALPYDRTEIASMMKLIVAGAASLLPADSVRLRMLDDDDELRLAAASGLGAGPPSVHVGRSFSGLAAKNRSPVVSLDCSSDARLDPVSIKWVQNGAVSSFVAVPMLAGAKVLGVLGVGWHQSTRLSDPQIERLCSFANQSANALHSVLSSRSEDRLFQKQDGIVEELGTRLARVEDSLGAHDQLLKALANWLSSRDVERGKSKVLERLAVDSPGSFAALSSTVPSAADLLLYKAYRSGELADFIDDALDPLMQEDGRYDLELIATLASYLENCCNMAKTARELFVHLNTVKYRLQRCEELGHFNLEEASTRFRLQLALRVARMAGRCNF